MPFNGDDDSSFDYVHDAESFSDTVSDSFEFINPLNLENLTEKFDKTANSKNTKNEVHITTAIVGQWKLVHSDNLAGYIESQKLPEITTMAWEQGIVNYEFKEDGLLHLHTDFLGKQISQSVVELEVPVFHEMTWTVFRVEDNCLNTMCRRVDGDMGEKWRIERSVVDGQLIVINKNAITSCKRVYERVI